MSKECSKYSESVELILLKKQGSNEETGVQIEESSVQRVQQVFIKCRVNFVEETVVVMKKQVFRLTVMKNQMFRECIVNFIEETGMVMEKQAFRLMVMKNQVFRECRANFIEETGMAMEKQAFQSDWW